jgi:hypothetical protein
VDSPCQPGAFAGFLAHKNGQHHNRKFSMDIVFLGGLAIDTVIGIYDWERENRQTVIFDIEMAFKWGKPANISSHRCNYVGDLNLNNRDFGLAQLELLLASILKKWPEVEFMTAKELGDLIAGK